MSQIHKLVKQAIAGYGNPTELARLVEEENQYWEQQDKSTLTVEQRQEYRDWLSMYDCISGGRKAIDDCFKDES
jgi:hypothetical protein